MKKAKHPAPGEVMEALQDYDWPGNVRELKNIIERMVVLSEDGKIRIEDIPEQVRTKKLWEISNAYQGSDTTLADARGGFEREFILRALDKTGWNITKAANELGIARKNLYRKMKEYKIQS